ncbi:MAG: Coenzyme F420 hydrogenase/dehydrogenase, beta subunit C-terminal domain [Promethearchaeota archaeon]
MNEEKSISWDSLHCIALALDSYKVRALIDAREDILKIKKYSEKQYEDLLFSIFDLERLKYALFKFLERNSENSLETIMIFAKSNNIPLRVAFKLFELLKIENLITIEKNEFNLENDVSSAIEISLKNYKIHVFKGDISKIKSIYQPVKIIFESNICSGCGLCSAICPLNCLSVINGNGSIEDEKCIRCGLCYFVCPRSFLPISLLNMVQSETNSFKITYELLGYYKEIYSARSKIPEIREKCQDGGITSTCLYYLLDKKLIDKAIGARISNDPWKPEPYIISTKEDILLTAGTKYVNNANLSALKINNANIGKIAVIGVPCQMQALLKSEIYDINFPMLKNIEYRIGIFCMESFSYESFLKICEILKAPLNEIRKTDINKGKFFIYLNDGTELSIPIKEITHLARKDCKVCYDLTSESADISIGSIGSPSGWNTVIIRTSKGMELFQNLIKNNLIEVKNISEIKPGLPLLEKITNSKKTKCKKHINEKKSKKEKIPSYY